LVGGRDFDEGGPRRQNPTWKGKVIVMTGDPKQCRAYAAQCSEMAAKARNPEHKRMLTNLAQSWLGIAAELESSRALLDAYPSRRDGADASGATADLAGGLRR
jgi:hypothetical protein